MIRNGESLLLRRRNKGAASFVLAAAVFFFSLLAFSCSSTPEAEKVEPLSLVDPSAPLVIYIPAGRNRAFVEYALSQMAGLSEKSSSTVAERTDCIAVSTDSSGAFEIASSGSYPKIGINSAFSEKNGWKSSRSNQTDFPFNIYSSEKYDIQVSSPDTSLIAAGRYVSPMLRRYENERRLAVTGSEAEGGGNDLDSKIYDYLRGGDENEIRFYSSNPAGFISKFLGKTVGLGLNSIRGSLVQAEADNTFALDLELELSDRAVAKAAVKILKLALFPVPAKIVQTEETDIKITDISLTYSQLLGLVRR